MHHCHQYIRSPPCCMICLVALLCSSQKSMSEFAAFFRSLCFHRSCWIGISDSIMGASIQTCASAFNHNLVILYLSLHSPYNMLFQFLQHVLSHSINVCDMLDLQYVLSSHHCLYRLAFFPMTSCSHPAFMCCWNAVLYC